MEIDLVKLVENLRLQVSLPSPSLSMENLGLSRMKRSLRWTWLRLSTKRHHARNAEAEAAAAAGGFTLSNRREGLAVMLEPDVTFTVGDRQFSASRSVLAAGSPVFESELFGPMRETSTRHVKIEDMDPAVFEALLHFMATGALPEDSNDDVAALQHLLVAADRYGMHRLMAACEWKLCRSIDVETVASTLALAEQHRRAKLKDACIRFVSTKSVLCAVRETEGFTHLVESCPLVMVDMLEHKLPSRVTRMLSLCGTQAQRGLMLLGTKAQRGLSRLTRLGTKVASWFHGLGHHVDWGVVGIIVGFFALSGLLPFLEKRFEAQERSRRISFRFSKTESALRNPRQEPPLISMIASFQGWLRRQHLSSWIPKFSLTSLQRLQEFQESAWINSDI